MSLINDMLRDLEVRTKQEKKTTHTETPAAVADTSSKSGLWLFAAGFLLLGAVVWLGLKLLPGAVPVTSSLPIKATVQQSLSEEEPITNKLPASLPQPAADTRLNAQAAQTAVTPASLSTAFPLPQNAGAKLLGMEISESALAAQLRLTFVQLPEYRLLQNGVGAAQLVVSFKRTQLGDDFDVPELTGGLLQRISLLPQQESLQLLVDLDGRAQVQSFQLVESAEREYQLVIELAGSAPAVEPRKEQSLQSAAKVTPAPVSPVQEPAQPVVTETARVSKNDNPLSRDQQAYQAGLAQLDKGEVAAAEASFIQALVINPELLEARLQLITLLIEQQEQNKAETQLRQGLVIAPGNAQLRKQYARFLLDAQRHTEAINLLQTSPIPAISQDLEYHALLAALLQETNKFTTAADLYGRLLQVRPEQAVWWLGLAISMDQSGNFDQARNAYERALALPGLRPDLQDYINNRLQFL